MRLPEARRPSCISSRRAAAIVCALFRVALAAAAVAAALVGSDPAIAVVLPIGPDGGSLLCSGRSGRRTPRVALADGSRPWGATGRLVMPGQTGLQPNDVAFALAPDGSLRVTWIETNGFMLDRLMARRLDPDGRMPWPEPVAMLEAIGVQERSEVVMPDGALLVAAAVTTLDMPAAPGDIIAQAIDARGRTKTAVAGPDVCRADRLQSNPLLMPTAGGSASLLWVDKADNYFTQSLAYTSAPRLAPPSFTPLLRQGRPIVVTIEVDDLAADFTATMGAGIEVLSAAVDPIQVDGPGDRLLITLRAAANAPLGPRALRIINPDGSAAEVPAVVNGTLDPARIDIDGSRLVDGLDLALLAARFGARVEQ